jgi:predicted amino acid racemase
VANAQALALEARRLDLRTYVMSKQHNRNPYINALASQAGLGKIVAVDATCALHTIRYGGSLGHVGHLNQIPRHLIPAILKARPEVWTVYSLEQARFINEAARDLGLTQALMLRVWQKGDVFFKGQEAGFELGELPAACAAVQRLDQVRIVGATAFPCMQYNETRRDKLRLTPNAATVMRAVACLEAQGIAVSMVNMPGNTSTLNMALLKNAGATHVEPGNAILGTTPSNAFTTRMPERVAFAYVSELSHFYRGRAYALGGGCYHTNYSRRIPALLGASWEQARRNRVDYDWNIRQDIDYHMQFRLRKGQSAQVGDSVVLAYRTQMHMTRAYVAVVSGISGHRPLQLHALFDNACHALDADFNPLAPAAVTADIERLKLSYPPADL